MLSALVVFAALASNVTAPAEPEALMLPEVVVYGRSTNLLGIASSAAQGTVGAEQIRERAVMRTGEVLETIPGVIVTQHAGGGKANQYFLRGFNLDHGTDFLTTLDGMPLNNPSHGHGQGYTDMNSVIPELIQRIDYQKGGYFAENGDFSSAGAAHMKSFQLLDRGLAKVEAGMYGYARAVVADSPAVGAGHLLYGLELHNYDGPWVRPDDYRRANGVLTYSQGSAASGFSVTGRGYYGVWDSSDQIAESAVRSGIVPFNGTLDQTTGGQSDRYSLQAEWHRRDSRSASKVAGYWANYQMDLFSNFTYFFVDTERGDQFEQVDRRNIYGLTASHTLFNSWWGRQVENEAGVELRYDDVHNGLFNTEAQRRTPKTDEASGDTLPAEVRSDHIRQAGLGLYARNRIRWAALFRTELGLREDVYLADVNSNRPENSGRAQAQLPSPKATLVFGPWQQTELYLQGGLGFHSNDARGATTKVAPVSGEPVAPADPLVRTRGAEVGVRTLAIPNMQSTVSLWALDIDSELLFVGDAGSTEASRPSRRYGVEWANYYELVPSLTIDADFSWSHARFTDADPAGDRIPGSIEMVVATGATYRHSAGWYAGPRLRYFGPRPLIEDNSFRSKPTILLSANAGYALAKNVTLSAEVYNLLDRKDHDIDYAYESRVTPTAQPVTQIHFHPVEPISLRAGIAASF